MTPLDMAKVCLRLRATRVASLAPIASVAG